ncbi:hypothetical protein PR048_011986 [Dryococelus australis]|uniref:Uncharacterized protein n=1 Tax=Dryococelus australis TaxID=614101 RepID=A0ABQ9HNV7_9NEOP|nr:hypothetical protein PR048_011986 [Dryococelus australis]
MHLVCLYPNASKVIMAVLSFSHGSGDVKRILTNDGTSLLERTLNAIITIKSCFRNDSKSYVIPATNVLLKMAQNAHKHYTGNLLAEEEIAIKIKEKNNFLKQKLQRKFFKEANEKLKKALTHKNFQEVELAKAMLQGVNFVWEEQDQRQNS